VTGPDRDETAAQLQAFFAARPDGIAAVWLFGSVARGTARPDSDVDVGVLWADDRSPEGGASLDVEGELERHVGHETQLVVLNRAPVDLTHRVLRDGILVFEGNARARIAFEVRTRNEYFDLLPHLRRYRRHG
jgi:predicted nucleotidyltransferase